MGIVREVKIAKSKDIVIHLPDDMVNKEIEIIIKETTKKPLKFDAFRIDTKQFKFNREEANER